MSLADLQRLIKQATPRVEDHRSVDRGDFVRREHGHLSFREVVDALTALEFSASSFDAVAQRLPRAGLETPLCSEATDTAAAKPQPQRSYDELLSREKGVESEATDTAVHALSRSIAGLEILGLTAATAEPPSEPEALEGSNLLPAAEAAERWEASAKENKAKGTECFKAQDWKGAVALYGAALAAMPASQTEDTRALFSNRCAALLGAGNKAAALADAERCVATDPAWPKGHFRKGCCLRELGRLEESYAAFLDGSAVEPGNSDWAKEAEKTDALLRALPHSQVRQMVFALMPELMAARVRCGDGDGVLVVKVDGELAELGEPKWDRINKKLAPAKASIRICFSQRKEYLANLVENLKNPADGVASVDLQGQPLKLAEISKFLTSDENRLAIQLDVRNGGPKNMGAIICRIPFAEDVKGYVTPVKDPAAPKGDPKMVLDLQRKSGFPKMLPRYLGFINYPGDLNFPVIDLERDAPEISKEQQA